MPPEAFDISYSPTRASDIYRYRITEPSLNYSVVFVISELITPPNFGLTGFTHRRIQKRKLRQRHYRVQTLVQPRFSLGSSGILL